MQPLPKELKFPSCAQASERALFEGVTHLPSMTPEQDKEGVAQVYTVHESGLLRFCDDYGISEMLSREKIARVYKNVVTHR